MKHIDYNQVSYETTYIAKFHGRENFCGLHFGHEYLIKVTENRPYGIEVNVYQDITNDEDYIMKIPYTNLRSSSNYWDYYID